MRRIPGLAVAVVLVVATAGCGGRSRAGDASASRPGADGAAAPTTTTAEGSSKKSGPKPAGGEPAGSSKSSSKSSKATTTTTVAGPKAAAAEGDMLDRTFEIRAELGSACVRPGGTQTILIRTVPDAGVGYDTVYADGLSGAMENHYGGNFVGYTDEDGTWGHTWTVAATAPAGRAAVRVLGSHAHEGYGGTEVHFAVADALGNCD